MHGKYTVLLAAFALVACAPQTAQETTVAEQSQTQMQSSQLQLIVFHADWCAFCRAMAPIYTDVANSERQRLGMTVIDHDSNMDLVRANNVTGLPTTLVVRDGVVLERREGVMSREDLLGMINRAAEKTMPENRSAHIATLSSQTVATNPAASLGN